MFEDLDEEDYKPNNNWFFWIIISGIVSVIVATLFLLFGKP